MEEMLVHPEVKKAIHWSEEEFASVSESAFRLTRAYPTMPMKRVYECAVKNLPVSRRRDWASVWRENSSTDNKSPNYMWLRKAMDRGIESSKKPRAAKVVTDVKGSDDMARLYEQLKPISTKKLLQVIHWRVCRKEV